MLERIRFASSLLEIALDSEDMLEIFNNVNEAKDELLAILEELDSLQENL